MFQVFLFICKNFIATYPDREEHDLIFYNLFFLLRWVVISYGAPTIYRMVVEHNTCPWLMGQNVDSTTELTTLLEKLCSIFYISFLSFEVGCHILWCTNNIQNGCRTQHMPMADGTKCGLNKVSTLSIFRFFAVI